MRSVLQFPSTFLKRTFGPLAVFAFFLMGSVLSAQSTCSENKTASGSDSDPTEVVFTSFPCTGGGTITAMDLTTNNSSSFCPSWYSYSIEVIHGGGTETTTGNCNVTSLDLATFNGATINVSTISSVRVFSVDDDFISDNVTVDATLNITFSPPACPAPNSLTATNITTTTVDLGWTENGTATVWDIEYGAAGFTQGAGTTITGTTTNPYNLTGLTADTEYDYYVLADCGATDGKSSWVGPYTFFTAANPLTLPYPNDFETTISDFRNDPSNGTNWVINSTLSSSGASSVHNGYASNANDIFLLPNPIDLSAYTNPVFLSFDHIAKTEGGWDYGYVEYSSDGGSTWQAIPNSAYLGGASDYNTEVRFHEDSYTAWGTFNTTPDNTWWQSELFDLTGLSTGSIQIRFRLTSDGSAQRDGWYIDNLLIEENLCPDPSNLNALNITNNSAQLTWVENGPATNWEIEWGTAGFTQGAGTTITGVTSNPYSLGGLSFSTGYDFYVRSDCAAGGGTGQSNWAGPYTFTTACSPIVAPITESFDNTTIPACWSTFSSTGETFDFGSNSYAPSTDNTGNGGEYASVDDSESPSSPDVTLQTPFIDVSGVTNPELQFFIASADATVSLRVDVWNGTDWTAGVYSHAQATTNTWDQENVNLVPFLSGNVTAIRFIIDENNGDYQNDVAIDDVSIQAGPSCPAPLNLTAPNLTATTADLSWVSGSASDWEVEYGLSGFSLGAGTRVAVNGAPNTTISGLSANTDYEVYVRDSCGVGDVSPWIGPIGFTTLCLPFTAPYAENFDNTTPPSLPDCWSKIEGGNAIQTSTSTDHGEPPVSAPNVITINDAPAGTNQILVSPQFSDMGSGSNRVTVQVSFEGGTSGNPTLDTLFIGVMTDPADGATFTILDTLVYPVVDDRFRKIIVNLDNTGLIGSAEYIGFKYANAGGDWEFFIDDFVYEAIPACPEPTPLYAANITATTADLSWTANGGFNSFDVEYGPAGFSLGTGTRVAAVTNTFLNITGLSQVTSYDYFVRATCGGGSFSSWTGPFSFNTGISPAQGISCSAGNATAVFTEEFDAVNGWTGDINGGDDTWEIPGASGSGGTGPGSEHSGPAGSFMNFEASNSSVSSGAIVSPAIDLSAGNEAAELSFWMHAYGADMGTLTVSVGTSPNGPFTSIFAWSGQLQTADTDPWQNVGVDLSNYLGQIIYLQFHQLDDQGGIAGDMSIDLVEVTTCITCPSPSALNATNVTANSVDLDWTAGGGETEWIVEYGPAGFPLGTGSTVVTTSNPFSLPGLFQSTDYDCFVRAICGPGDTSSAEGPVSITTSCGAPIAGTFTIDPNQPRSGTNFISFSNAVNVLNNCGISGPVMINVAAGMYMENITLTDIAGTNLTDTIVFDGADSAQVHISHSSTTDEPTIYFNGADRVTFRNMTVSNTSSSDAWGIMFQNSSDSNNIDRCHIMVPVTTSSDVIGLVTSGSLSSDITDGDNANYLTVSNSLFTGGEAGVHLHGDDGSNATYNLGNKVINSVFRNQEDHAISVDGQDSLMIVGNHVSAPNNSGSDAVYLLDLDNFYVAENKVRSNDYGIYINDGNDGNSPGSYSSVVNNVAESSGGEAIYLNDVTNTNVYHNTGNGTIGMLINDDENLSIYNNIFTATGDYAFESTDPLDATTLIDYNVYHRTDAGDLFEEGSTVYADLAAWQAADATRNVNSLQADPVFANAGAFNYKPISSAVDNLGDALGVMVDITGASRPATSPDVGAYEFSGISEDIALNGAELVARDCPTANDSLYVALENAFGGPVDFSVTPLTVVWDVTGPVNSNGTFTINTGTLAAAATDTFGADGVDFSVPGTYSLSVLIQPNLANESTANDTLFTNPTLNVNPLIEVTPAYDTIRSRGTTKFISASSPLFPKSTIFFFSEISHYVSGSGGPTGGTPVPDDYLEITGAPNADLAGYTLEQWEFGSLESSVTFGPGTVLSPNGTAIITIGTGNTSDPANFVYDGRGASGTWSSSTNAGRILKDPAGNIIDAVGYDATYSFPAASGVTAADWSGSTGSTSGSAGIRLIGPDNNDASNWVVASASDPQDPGMLNANVPLPSPPAFTGLTWTNSIDGTTTTNADTTIGPFSQGGFNTYEYVATYNGVCGIVSDTARIVVDLPCLPPSNLDAFDLASMKAMVSWTPGEATNFNIQYGPTGFTLGTGTMVSASNDTLELTGLVPQTSYDYFVRDSCSVGYTSNWVGPYTFTTICAPTAVTRNNVLYLDASGNAALPADSVDDNSNGICAIASKSVSPAVFTCADAGPQTVTLSVTNAYGESNSATATVTVMDTISPVVVVQPITAYLDATGNVSITASDVDNGSTDACGIATTILDKNTFTCSDIGPNTVTTTVTDVNGNSNAATTTVTVMDTISPMASAQAYTAYLNSSGNATIIAADVDNGSSDACGIASMSVNPSSFGCAESGPNAVTLTVTGVNGNTSTATATVTVMDTISPWIDGSDITVALDSNGQAIVQPVDVVGSDDYSVDQTGTFNPVSMTGATVISLSDDHVSSALPLGFGFTFYDSTYTEFHVSSNGFITFSPSSSGCCSGQNIPSISQPNNIIAFAWADLNPSNGGQPAANLIQYQTMGTAPNRVMVLEFFNVDHFFSGNRVTAQVHLYEGTNRIEIHTTAMPSDGGLHTMGVENIDGTKGTAVPGRNSANWSAFNDYVAFIPAGGAGDNCQATTVLAPNTFTCNDIGANSATLTITDASGNTGSDVVTITIIDTIAPVVMTQPYTAALDANGSVSISASDVDNGTADACGIASMMVSPNMFTCSDVGTNMVTLTVTDNNGNIDSATTTVTVIDTVSPMAMLQNHTAYLDASGNVTIDSSDVDNGSNDACGVEFISLSNNSFSCADVGPNTVAVTVVDSNGNSTTTNTTVTVVDTVNPMAMAMDITIYLDGNGQQTIVPADVDNGSSDNCGIASLDLDTSNFDCADIGMNPVVLTAMDNNGNSDTAWAMVTVIDTVSPSVTTKNHTAYLDASGSATIDVLDVSSGSSSACSIDTVIVDITSFTCVDLGPNTVNVTATASGGTASNSASATVTVVDTISPTVVTQTFTTYLDASGNASIVATDVEGGSTDNCTVVSYSVDISTFDCTDLGANTVILTVTDQSGNTSSAPATVMVVDTITPVANSRDRTVYLDANGMVTITPAMVNLGSSDNCLASSTLSLSKATYTCADEGLNQEYLLITDADGNVDSTDFLLTVLDTISPSMITKNITVQLGATGQVSIAPSQLDSLSSDNCSNQLFYTASKTTFNCSDLGMTTVTLTGTDVHGNSSSATAIVMVEDNLAPTTRAQNVTLTLDASGNATLTTAMVNNGSTDNCSIASLSLDQMSFTCADLGTNTVSLTATDGSGNSASANATITVIDNMAPTALAQNTTVQLDANGNASLTAMMVNNGSNDNCSISTMSVSPSNFDCTDVGANTITLTVTDGSGNPSSATATVTVEDNIAPVVTTRNITVSLDASGSATILAADVNNGSADACGIATMSVSPSSFTCSDLGLNTVTLTATDVNGNSSTGTAVVTVMDNMAPTVVTTSFTAVLDANGQATITPADVNNGSSDNCNIASYSLDVSTFTCNALGQNAVNLTVTDQSGNSATGTAIVSVVDNSVPTVSTQNITVQLNASGQVSIQPSQINSGSTDNCNIAGYSLDISTFTCADVGANTVTLTATDGSGNSATGTATVTVQDNVAPIAAAQNITVQLNSTGNATISAASVNNGSTDACGISGLSVSPSSFTCADLGSNSVILTVTDNNGNTSTATATVTVVDNIAPTVITQNVTVYLNAAGTASITAADVNNGSTDNCSVSTTSVSQTSFSCADRGQNLVTLTVTDGSGNSASAGASVIVVDTISPSINNLPANITAYATAQSCAANVSWTNITGADNCSVASVVTSQANGSSFNLGNTMVSVTVTDGAGNTSSGSFMVTVVDTIAPVFTAVPSNISITPNPNSCDATVTWSAPSASDNCSAATISTSVASGSTFNVGNTTVTYTATDAAGNSRTGSFVITVTDQVAPTISNTPANIVTANDAGACDAVVSYAMPAVGDNCTGASISSSHPSGGTFPVGTTNVTFTATDGAGNTSTSSFTITVEDREAPVATSVPASDTVGECNATYTYTTPTGTDNCSAVTVRQIAGLPSGAVFPAGPTVNQFELIDASGNRTLVNFTIFIVPQGTPQLPSLLEICANADPVEITGGQNITWSGNGIVNSGTTFDPGRAGAGRHALSYTFTDSEGCQVSGTIQVTVTPQPKKPVVSKSASNTLTTGNYNDYQWYRDGVAISGATNQSYTYTVGGNYQVMVGNSFACTNYSDGFVVGTSGGGIGLDEEVLAGLEVFPNPSNGVVNIALKVGTDKELSVTLFSIDGKKVYEKAGFKTNSSGNIRLDFGNLPTATYFLHIRTEDQVAVRKLLMN